MTCRDAIDILADYFDGAMPTELAALAAPLVEADIGRDPIDPAAQRRTALEARTLVDDLQEDVLHDLLGVRRAARDTVREPIDA